MSIATTIFSQLGGNRFKAMTGANNFIDHGDGISFYLPKNKVVAIKLNGKDLYDISFGRINKNCELIKTSEHNDIYNDMLIPIFEEQTGLYTSL